MPGFGGSVRLPRLLGADSALEIAAGKDVGADQALKIGASLTALLPRKNCMTARWRFCARRLMATLDWKAKRQPKLEPLKLSKIEAAMTLLPKVWSRKPENITRRRSPR